MKRFVIIMAVIAASLLTAGAQSVRNSRFYNPNTGRLDYSRTSRPTGCHSRYAYYPNAYYGLRVGPSFTSVISDSPFLDGGGVTTGLNVGVVAGFEMIPASSIFFETGLNYTEKGGKGKVGGDKFSYNLNYLELPLTLKYIAPIDRGVTIQPFIGGYVAAGVGGKIKDYGSRTAYSSFGDGIDQFKRFDGGLRLGCGLGMDMFYAELGYELGLANVGQDDFDDTRNSALMLTLGLNF